MIEVIYKEEKQEDKGNEAAFTIPRNIRQIGLINGNCKIYMEDYVYTFLGKTAEKCKKAGSMKGGVAVLTGAVQWWSGNAYVFIRGALAVQNMEATAEHIGFTDEIWKQIHEEEAKYFEGQEIVGWFFTQPELVLEVTEVLKRVHLKYFGGGEKVLMLMEPVEREDAFFCYENGFMVKQSGYYLYYERNPQMQTYMLDKNSGDPSGTEEVVEDEAVKSFRRIIRGKGRQPEPEEDGPSVFSYAATACLAIAVLVAGAGVYRNYRAMNRMEQQAEEVSSVPDGGNTLPTVTEAPAASKTSVREAQDQDRKVSASEKEEETAETGKEIENAKAREEAGNAGTAEGTENAGTVDGSGEQTGQEGLNTEHSEADGKTGSEESEPSGTVEETYSQESDLRKEKYRAKNRQKKTSENAGRSAENGEAASAEAHSSYVIRPGDTLYQISIEKYGDMAAISEICRLNGISENEIIYPGQIIVLP